MSQSESLNRRVDTDHLADSTFRISVMLKGLGGAAELLTGLALIFISVGTLKNVSAHLGPFGHEIAGNLSEGTRLFIILYAISRGAIRLGLAVALLQLRLWAYPVAIVFLLSAVIYQLWLLIHHLNIGLILLTLFDLLIIGLTWYEYRKLKRGGHIHKGLI